MRNFNTQVEYIKYKVLKEVASFAWQGNLFEHLLDIPKIINPTNKPISRCCVYKEHAILSERVKLAIGGLDDQHMIEVIDIACDECPVGGYEVTNGCRGCLAHKCQKVCPKDAISFDQNNKAHIDKEKCIECGMCAKVCPFSAIKNNKRPCINACKVKAIEVDDEKHAVIDHDKCIECGACVVQCPFGAIMDRSYIIDVIDGLKDEKVNAYAVVAPSIASQYHKTPIGKVVGGLKELGFKEVIEAALGADIVSELETKEWIEKEFLTSSCCPAFVSLIEKHYLDLKSLVSHNLSPMAIVGKLIKEKDSSARVVFIGPCIAKKKESRKKEVSEYIDQVITFEELDALFDSRDIVLENCQDYMLEDASAFGRIFARSGGLIESIKNNIKKQDVDESDFQPVTCNGIDECKIALMKKSKNVLKENFIEGMICAGGCIGGPASLSHTNKDTFLINQFSKESKM